MPKQAEKTNEEVAFEMSTLRRKRKLKSGWVASQMGVKPSFLSELENGKRVWTERWKIRFLTVLAEA